MSDGLIPAPGGAHSLGQQLYEDPRPASPPEQQGGLERPVAALRRYKWLITAIVVVGAALGVVGSRFITPMYEVRATVWVATAQIGPNAGRTGPIATAALLNNQAWIELFRSFKVVDEVVLRLKLYIATGHPADRPLFAGIELAERYLPGDYELIIYRDNKNWRLSTPGGLEVERGPAADSVGRKVGLKWVLPDSVFTGTGMRTVGFSVIPPREKSLELVNRVQPRLQLGSNFLWLTFTDASRERAQQTLNLWVHEFVRVAATLKKGNVSEFAKILEGQLKFAEKATQEAEAAYQNFRVNTIILPTEGGPVAAGAAGIAADRDPALVSFFTQKIEYDNLRYDREALEKTMASAAAGNTPYEGMLFIPSVAESPGAASLRDAFTRQYALLSDLRTKQSTFTSQHPAVIAVSKELETVQTQTIPRLADQLLQQLKSRESDILSRIQAASQELREIPPRTIEERRLSRGVQVSEALYTNLKARFAEAQLAEAGATPDVNVHDTAIAPTSPTKNTTIMVILGALFASLGAAIALAILLDQVDGKLRYPFQASSDLGLTIAGAVPRIPKGGIDARSPEQVVQFLETFRSLRMHVMHSVRGERITLAVTSPAPSDGKSLISTNLALSFAEAGLKTVLVDGDTRRGSLHRMHGLTSAGGLTEYLAGQIEWSQAVRTTGHENLSFVSCGIRHPRSPELLASPRLKRLVDRLSENFDVVIFDTPPLAAGIDGYAISAAAGRVMMVLRMGQTERRLAAAKLATLDRLPVEIVGAVLNDVPLTGEFQYYTYASGYSVGAEEEPAGALARGSD